MSNLDLKELTGDCLECGPGVKIYRSGNRVRCRATYHPSNRTTLNRRRKLAAEKMKCDRCGFRAVHMCQLDVDHIDGDWTVDEENLQVLCANCHRLKTYQSELYAMTDPRNDKRN
jgi:hypothetical protein